MQAKYNLIKPINSGKYGTVYIAKHVEKNTEHAIKVLPKNRMDIPKAKNDAMIRNEIDNMTLLRGHKNIVNLEEVLQDTEAFYLVEEFCGGDTLAKSVFMNTSSQKSRTHICPVKAALTDIINAVSHCHQNGILYADLKPENIVFSKINVCYKLTDFGSSCKINPHTNEAVLLTTTPIIAPPNDFTPNCPIVTLKYDVWSIGMIAKLLYQSNNLQDDGMIGFIKYCLQPDYRNRLSSEQMQSYWYEIIS